MTRFRQHELLLLLLLIALCLVIECANPSFLTVANVLSMLKSSATPGILALGVLVVLISGDIDISFPAIAAFSMYVTCRWAQQAEWLDQIAVLFVVSAAVGCALGVVNAALVHCFHLPALIVTLGTASLIRGGLLALIGTRILTDLPASLITFSKTRLFPTVTSGEPVAGLAIPVLVFAVLAVVTHLVLTHTMLGRGIYALGGAPESARRVGFDILRIRFFMYGYLGLLVGIVGLMHASTVRNANPFDLEGMELTVIAAVVLGGTNISGGRGSVLGTVLGVAVLVVMGNSLILVGLPSQWHKVALGLVIIASTGLTAWRGKAVPQQVGAAS